MRGLTSPVKAPSIFSWQFWAPSATGEPITTPATPARYGNGGHTAARTFAEAPTPWTTPRASASAVAALVNIFQLPAMNFWRMGTLSERLVHDRRQRAQAAHQLRVARRQEGLRAVGQGLLRAA